MAKREIRFNDEVYSIEESVIEASLAEMKSRLVDDYSGSGTILVYDGTTINVDSAKLAAAASNLAAMLNRFAGSGANIVVNGVTYGIDSAKLNSANTKLHITLSDLQSGGGGGSDEPTDAELNEYGFYYDVPYSAEIEQGITYHVVLKEGGVGELYATVAAELAAELFGASETMKGVPASILMGAEMSPSWTLLEDGTLLFDMTGDGSQQMPFVVVDNGLALTVMDGGEPMFNFVCTFEEYSDIYFEQTYHSCTAEFPDFIFKADGSAIAGDYSYPAGTLTYGPHKISLGGESVLVSMNGKDLYLGGTKIGTMTPCTHSYQIMGYECLDSSIHEITKICSKCGHKIAEEEEHFDLNDDGYCDHCGWNANTKDIAGLYETGTTNLVYSWRNLQNDGILNEDGSIVSGQEANLVGDLVIPDTITVIGAFAFNGCANLESIEIPASVTHIGSYAFCGCTNLESIEIPASVIDIGTGVFERCESLMNVTFAEESQLTYIASDMFKSCTNLESIEIPASVTTIYEYAFDGCTNLTSVTFAEESQLTTIGNYVFRLCGLTSIELPTNVTTISNDAFLNCSSLASITIPASVTTIRGGAFARCNNLKTVYYNGMLEQWCNLDFVGDYHSNPLNNGAALYINGELVNNIVIPDTITDIRDYTFYGCTGLTGVTIPDSVTTIGGSAFSHCSGLTSVTIPDSAITIGDGAFSHCSGLTSVTIPDSAERIGHFAFANCTNLENITIPFVGESLNGTDNTHFGYIFGAPIADAHEVYVPTSLKTIVISGGSNIDERAFAYCYDIENITIPDSVTSIGNYAFGYCNNLTSIIFDGTTAQWNAISKSDYWNNDVPATYVQCSDGQVAL